MAINFPATTAQGIARLDKVRSVYSGHINSVVYNGGVLQNGQVGVVGDLVSGERELCILVAPTNATTKGIGLIASSEIVYSQFRLTDNALENYNIPAGQAARIYQLEKDDIFSVSYPVINAIAGGVGGTPVKGNYVVCGAGTFNLTELATLVGTEGFVGKIIDLEQWGTTTYVGQNGAIQRITNLAVIRVQSN